MQNKKDKAFIEKIKTLQIQTSKAAPDKCPDCGGVPVPVVEVHISSFGRRRKRKVNDREETSFSA